MLNLWVPAYNRYSFWQASTKAALPSLPSHTWPALGFFCAVGPGRVARICSFLQSCSKSRVPAQRESRSVIQACSCRVLARTSWSCWAAITCDHSACAMCDERRLGARSTAPRRSWSCWASTTTWTFFRFAMRFTRFSAWRSMALRNGEQHQSKAQGLLFSFTLPKLRNQGQRNVQAMRV